MKTGEIKLTTNYVLLVVYDRPTRPRVAKKWKRSDANEQRAKDTAKRLGIELLG